MILSRRTTKRPLLSRRALLRGATAAIGLPILEAMLDGNGRLGGVAHAGGALVPPRLLMMFVPNGFGNGGDEYTILPSCLEDGPLTPHASEVLLLTELSKVDQYAADTSGRGDAHATGHTTFATGTATIPGGAGGPSVDQYAAELLGGTTQFRSLVTTLKPYDAEAYFNAVSWSGPATAVPPRDDPAALLTDLFGNGEPMPEHDYRASLLDHVQADILRLQSRLGSSDRQRLEQHLSAVRDVEKQITTIVTCEKPGAPEPTEDLSNERARALLDLMILAFQCDSTRFGSFMLGNRPNQRQFPWIGVVGGYDDQGYEEGHHGMSHDPTETGRERLRKIVTDEVAQLAYVLERMRAIDEGAGTLLDNSIVFFGTEHATSNTHNTYGMQAIVAGRGGGVVPVGQTRACGGAPWANSFVSILNWLGIEDSTFGDYGSGPLPL